MADELAFAVVGLPAPQGSKRALRNQHTGRIHLVESSVRVAQWRQDVRYAAMEALDRAGRGPIEGPVEVSMDFHLPRPKGHWRTGRNAALLRDAAPAHPAGQPDLDKLVRSTADAITGVVLVDDAQIVRLTAAKHYALDQPGCCIRVSALSPVARMT